jgi:hypothetical protein
MEAATSRFPAVLDDTGEITVDEVDEEAGIPYSSWTASS